MSIGSGIGRAGGLGAIVVSIAQLVHRGSTCHAQDARSDTPERLVVNIPTLLDVYRARQTISRWTQRAFTSGSRFTRGDTLLARITPSLENGKTAFVDFLDEREAGWGSTEFIVLRPKPPWPPEIAYDRDSRCARSR